MKRKCQRNWKSSFLHATTKKEKERAAFTNNFSAGVEHWLEERATATANSQKKKPGEPSLTSAIVEEINNIAKNQLQSLFAHKDKPDGRIDIVLSPEEDRKESTPLMVIEVGLNSKD